MNGQIVIEGPYAQTKKYIKQLEKQDWTSELDGSATNFRFTSATLTRRMEQVSEDAGQHGRGAVVDDFEGAYPV